MYMDNMIHVSFDLSESQLPICSPLRNSGLHRLGVPVYGVYMWHIGIIFDSKLARRNVTDTICILGWPGYP